MFCSGFVLWVTSVVGNDPNGGIITILVSCEGGNTKGFLGCLQDYLRYLCLPAVQVNQNYQGSRSFLLNLALPGVLACQAVLEALEDLGCCWSTCRWESDLVRS